MKKLAVTQTLVNDDRPTRLESEKWEKYLDLARDLKQLWNPEGDGDVTWVWISPLILRWRVFMEEGESII